MALTEYWVDPEHLWDEPPSAGASDGTEVLVYDSGEVEALQRDLKLLEIVGSEHEKRIAELKRLLKYAIEYSTAKHVLPMTFIDDARMALNQEISR